MSRSLCLSVKILFIYLFIFYFWVLVAGLKKKLLRCYSGIACPKSKVSGMSAAAIISSQLFGKFLSNQIKKKTFSFELFCLFCFRKSQMDFSLRNSGRPGQHDIVCIKPTCNECCWREREGRIKLAHTRRTIKHEDIKWLKEEKKERRWGELGRRTLAVGLAVGSSRE